MSDLTPAGLVALGVTVGLLSTCVQSIGLTLQRKSHMLEDEKDDRSTHRPPHRRRRWQIGMFLFLLANVVGSSIQITTLPLPLLSTLQASGLVFNSILATLLLQEPWTRRTACGTVLVAAGAILISLFSALPEASHSLAQLMVLLRQANFLVWFVLSLLFVVAVLIMDFGFRKCTTQQHTRSARIRLIRGMSYGMVSGILSAHALLLAKTVVELIVTSVVDHHNQFRNYRSWIMLLVFLVLALSQLYYLHLGLKLISTSVLYPFVFCIYNIVAILDGLIYFRQINRLSSLHAGLIALGTVVLLSGVLALSWRFEDDEKPGHTEMLQAEIPQTLLTPGSGFAADPDDDWADDSLHQTDEDELDGDADEDDDLDPERSALLNRRRSKSLRLRPGTSQYSQTSRSPDYPRRRRRAATLKELSAIWQEFGDETRDDTRGYGTLADPSTPLAARSPDAERPASGPEPRGRADDLGGADAFDPEPLRRARTTPPRRPSGNRTDRRRKSGHEGGALFSDMLKRDWWRPRWGRDDEDDAAGDRRVRPRRIGSAPMV